MAFAYYNEIDPFAVEWLRALIKEGVIADGEVDSRSITEVQPEDLDGFTQCHFFAGIGVWSHALRSAGWPDDRPVWTGSCPCQPFSAAGKRKGFNDDRHFWPVWENLIAVCRPPTIFGEQVASKDGLNWLDLVHANLESSHYAVAAFDLCAAGVGAPHIRQRLYFVADDHAAGRGSVGRGISTNSDAPSGGDADRCGEVGELGHHHHHQGSQRRGSTELSERSDQLATGATGAPGALDNAELRGTGRRSGSEGREECTAPRGGEDERRWILQALHSGVNGFWSPADWIYCRDGKYRPVEPGTFPLAHGAPARVGRLRGYGNAICAPLATTFIEAFLDVERGVR